MIFPPQNKIHKSHKNQFITNKNHQVLYVIATLQLHLVSITSENREKYEQTTTGRQNLGISQPDAL